MGFAARCARATTGHAAAPPSPAMNARRFRLRIAEPASACLAPPATGSARARFPACSTPPTSGRCRRRACRHAFQRLSIMRALAHRIQCVLCRSAFPLASPSLAPPTLAAGSLRFVRRLPSYYDRVRLLGSVHQSVATAPHLPACRTIVRRHQLDSRLVKPEISPASDAIPLHSMTCGLRPSPRRQHLAMTVRRTCCLRATSKTLGPCDINLSSAQSHTPRNRCVRFCSHCSPVTTTDHSLPSGRYSFLRPASHRLDRTSLRLAHSFDDLIGLR